MQNNNSKKEAEDCKWNIHYKVISSLSNISIDDKIKTIDLNLPPPGENKVPKKDHYDVVAACVDVKNY